MSDSDDTDVLLLIPNDFFAVDEPESPTSGKTWNIDRRSSNLISFSSLKGPPRDSMANPEEFQKCNDFEEYCATHFENSLINYQSSSHNILKEIDSYLNQIPVEPQRHGTISTVPPDPPLYYQAHDRPAFIEPIRSETPSEIPSLKELWSSDTVHASKQQNKCLVEERLRRRHLEKNLEAMQMDLIEAQQKVSVALSVDQAKDNAIKKLRGTIKSLEDRVHATDDLAQRLSESTAAKDTLDRKCRELESELKGSLERSKNLKEANDLLEGKVAKLTTATSDIREVTKKQIDDLQIRLSNSLKAEQLINDELVKTRNQLVIEKNCHRENQELWNRKDLNFKSEMETLRSSLKHYYQKQLNDVVAQKLKEFQKQMDDLEVQLKMEYLRRERQIAERAIQQMELIFKKNEEEVRLLSEKHREEIKFIQLQLGMAQTTIGDTQQRIIEYSRGEMEEGLDRFKETKKELFNQSNSPKKLNNVNKTPVKQKLNHRTNSPELKNYIETLLKKSPRFNSTRKTPLK